MDALKNIKVANAFNDVINSLTIMITILRVLAVAFFVIQAIFFIKREKI